MTFRAADFDKNFSYFYHQKTMEQGSLSDWSFSIYVPSCFQKSRISLISALAL